MEIEDEMVLPTPGINTVPQYAHALEKLAAKHVQPIRGVLCNAAQLLRDLHKYVGQANARGEELEALLESANVKVTGDAPPFGAASS